MYLLTADEINASLSNQAPASGTAVSTGVRDVSRYSYPLGLIKTRCEELLEIATLDIASFTDTFEVTGRSRSEQTLRLTSGFLTADPAVTLVDSTGTAIDASGVEVDMERGLIFATLGAGRYKVSYSCGFTADEDKVYVGVPDWLKSIAKYAMALHYRLTTNADKTPANVSYADIIQAVKSDMFVRVTKRYNRPRVGALFPIRSIRNG